MAFFLPLLVAVVALAVLPILVFCPSWARTKIPRRLLRALTGVVVATGIGWGIVYAVSLLRSPSGPTTFSVPAPLAAKAKLPRLDAEGWLNGPPPRPGDTAARVLVVDVWAGW